jgi:hypothetical protein
MWSLHLALGLQVTRTVPLPRGRRRSEQCIMLASSFEIPISVMQNRMSAAINAAAKETFELELQYSLLWPCRFKDSVFKLPLESQVRVHRPGGRRSGRNNPGLRNWPKTALAALPGPLSLSHGCPESRLAQHCHCCVRQCPSGEWCHGVTSGHMACNFVSVPQGTVLQRDLPFCQPFDFLCPRLAEFSPQPLS